ncbi:MAG: ABC transporter permease [Candidatus Aureabacteria bacterium]|nr:ABC transporter permease [Candidatus Auribacterota bacterium]
MTPDFLTAAFLAGLLAAMLRMATPLLYASLGEYLSERSGVLNLGIEGIMSFGALTGFLTVYFTGNLWLAVLVAFLSGCLLAAVHAVLSVTLGVSQHVSGIGLTIFGSGLALYAYRLVIGAPIVPPQVTPFSPFEIPCLCRIPFLGPTLFGQYSLTYLALALAPLLWIYVYRTHWGLRLRAVGENPEAADSAGINVFRVRYASVILGGGLMSVGGAFLSIAHFNMFTPDIVAGRGWVSIALVVFGNWHPLKILLGALIFGGIDALQLRIQTIGVAIPYQYLLLLPYLVTILLLALIARRTSHPAALLTPYRRE